MGSGVVEALPAILAAVGGIVGPVFAYLIRENSDLRKQIKDAHDKKIEELEARLRERDDGS